MGTNAFSPQRAESFRHFGGQECPPHTVRSATGQPGADLRGLPVGALLGIDGDGVPRLRVTVLRTLMLLSG